MSIKKDDGSFLAEQLRGHISKSKSDYEDAVEAVCIRGFDEDIEQMENASKRYMALLRAGTLLTDVCA